MKVEDASILVTGGGSGIGRHLVGRFAGAGARVATLELKEDLCASLVEEFPGIRAIACDVTDPVAIEAALDELSTDSFPDVLVNNAGLIHSEPLVNLLNRDDPLHDLGMWRKTISTNLDSTFLMTRAMAGRWVRQRTRGVVVSVSSISAHGNAGQTAYAAAKAGINAMTATWAKELGPFGLRFAAIAPGFFDTPSTRGALSEANIDHVVKETPSGRLGDLDELFGAVRFLVENDFYNGNVLELNGGLTI